MRRRILILLLLVVLSVSMLADCLHGGTNSSAVPAAGQSARKITKTLTVLGSNRQSGRSYRSRSYRSQSYGSQSYTKPDGTSGEDISEDGQYSSKDEVARYIKAYGHLPSNYVTKKAARKAGWSKGSLEDCLPGCSIGGDEFKNREGLLPKASGRTYYECDIDTLGKRSRGAKRIVYSNDGLIYYSDDHYRSFTLLYGDESDAHAGQSGQSHTKPDGMSGGDISEDGQYSSKDEVARYIKAYGHLPSNYVTKKAARKAGWSKGSLEDCLPGCSIGGDEFKNREGLLPKASGRTYYECDIDTLGKRSRGAKRIIYSNDGLIYYTDDHYRSFTLLYGDESDAHAGQSGQSHTKPYGASGGDIREDGQYNSKDEVARYIKAYGHLPSNYVTKKAARKAGWSKGSLEDCLPGCSIGGDEFKNREGLLPKASGRIYYECDIDTLGKRSRGAKRIIYSNDGLIYYTDDHYRSFTLLYEKENKK